MLHLQLLPFLFVESLVVGHFENEIVYPVTERVDYLLGLGFRVLQGVVENRGHEHVHIVDLPHLGDQPGDFGAMPDVGTLFPPLSALLAMPVRCEVRSLEDLRDI